MDTQNTSRQLRYLEEVRIPLHRAGFETLPVEGEQLPVLWNDAPLCRITGKGSVFYRRADVDTPQAEDALYRVEDIAAKTLEYMTAMEAAPQLKASGLDGDYRILADFGGTVLALSLIHISPPAAAARLLRPLLQLCVGVPDPVLYHYAVFLLSLIHI